MREREKEKGGDVVKVWGIYHISLQFRKWIKEKKNVGGEKKNDDMSFFF